VLSKGEFLEIAATDNVYAMALNVATIIVAIGG
jgi:hypothetical protein